MYARLSAINWVSAFCFSEFLKLKFYFSICYTAFYLIDYSPTPELLHCDLDKMKYMSDEHKVLTSWSLKVIEDG